MSEISQIIKRLRSDPSSLSQTEIARRTGIPQPRISRWEAGEVAAGADDALKLVALANQMGFHVEPQPHSPADCIQAGKQSQI